MDKSRHAAVMEDVCVQWKLGLLNRSQRTMCLKMRRKVSVCKSLKQFVAFYEVKLKSHILGVQGKG